MSGIARANQTTHRLELERRRYMVGVWIFLTLNLISVGLLVYEKKFDLISYILAIAGFFA
jgi:hypothetical protein